MTKLLGLMVAFIMLPFFAVAGNLSPVAPDEPRIYEIFTGCELIDRGGYFNYRDPHCPRGVRAEVRDFDPAPSRIGAAFAEILEKRRQMDDDESSS